MAREKEVKIKLKVPLTSFIKRIESKGYKLLQTVKQNDIYFDTRDWFLYQNLAALRFRQVDGKDYSFSFKKMFYRPRGDDNYYVEEIEEKFPIKNFLRLTKIFKRLNIPFEKNAFKNCTTITNYLRKNKYYDEQKMLKIRKVYSNGCDEITIDDVDNVGIIVELECSENNPLTVVETLLAGGEWQRDIEGTSYIWLKNVKGLTLHLTNLDKFKVSPDWNVWQNEKILYAKIINERT